MHEDGSRNVVRKVSHHLNRKVWVFKLCDILVEVYLEDVLVDNRDIVKITQGIRQNGNQAVIDLKGHDFCRIFRQELSQSSNSGTDFDDIDLLINLSRIHNFLKDVGIGQEVLTEGFFKGKTVTLQHCLGHAIICNFHFFSFLISLGVKDPLYFRLNNWPSPLRLGPNKFQTTPSV